MKLVKIWFCEYLGTPDIGFDHGYGRLKQDAQDYVKMNLSRNYEPYSRLVMDGWAKPAVRIEVPEAVAETLILTCRI